MLQVNNASKSFNEKKILCNISLQVNERERIAIIGENGSGKTTLFKMIVGLLKPDEGQINFENDNLYTNPHNRKYIGYVPTESFFYTNLTVYENLELISGLFYVKDPEFRISELARELQVTSFLDKKINELSSGMLKKIQFAAAIIHRPKLVLMDEPFNALDVASHNLLYKNICDYDGSIIFTSHLPETVYDLSKKIYILKDHMLTLSSKTANDFDDLKMFADWYANQI